MPDELSRHVSIDVVSDVVCPWCYIGKRRLAAALAALPAQANIEVGSARWHPFELNPDVPPEGVDRRAYLAAKFGSLERAAQIYERVRAAGASVGIAFDFDRIARVPNTRDAHRLIAWTQGRADAAPLLERLFAAFFVEGRDLGDRDVLAALAQDAGGDAAAAREMLDSGALRTEVEASVRRAQELGIGGVPFFVLGGRLAVSGAQEPSVLAAAIVEAAAAPA